MQLSTMLWLALLVALGLLAVLVIRRMSVLIARTRDLERFQSAVDKLDRRFAAACRPLIAALDESRRHAAGATGLAEPLGEAQAIIDQLRAECRALKAPARLRGIAMALAADLDRAARATSFVEHGLGAVVGRSLGRDLEAQTAFKRGALNLRHAQEAFATRAREIAALRPTDLAPDAPPLDLGSPLSVYSVEGLDDLDDRIEPRM